MLSKSRRENHYQKLLSLLLITLWLQGCGYFYPKQIEFYDEDCQIIVKKYVLESVGIGGVGVSCQNEGCLIAMIPAATTAIISGSIVVVGNTIHWMEKQGRCLKQNVQSNGKTQ